MTTKLDTKLRQLALDEGGKAYNKLVDWFEEMAQEVVPLPLDDDGEYELKALEEVDTLTAAMLALAIEEIKRRATLDYA